MTLLGLAGLAEAGLAEAAGMMCCSSIFMMLLAVFAVSVRSQIAAWLSAALAVLQTLCCTPFRGFWPVPSDDPDVKGFNDTFRQVAWLWGIAVTFAAISLIWVCGLARMRREIRVSQTPTTENPEPTGRVSAAEPSWDTRHRGFWNLMLIILLLLIALVAMRG